jgi:hypothetical protein
MRQVVSGWFISLLLLLAVQAAPVWAAAPHLPSPSPRLRLPTRGPVVIGHPAPGIVRLPAAPGLHFSSGSAPRAAPTGSLPPIARQQVSIVVLPPARAEQSQIVYVTTGDRAEVSAPNGGVPTLSRPSPRPPAMPVLPTPQRATLVTFTPIPRGASASGASNRITAPIPAAGAPPDSSVSPQATGFAMRSTPAQYPQQDTQATQSRRSIPMGIVASHQTVRTVGRAPAVAHRAFATLAQRLSVESAAGEAQIGAEIAVAAEAASQATVAPSEVNADAFPDATLGSAAHGGGSPAACLAALLFLWSFLVPMKGLASRFWRLPSLHYAPLVPPG